RSGTALAPGTVMDGGGGWLGEAGRPNRLREMLCLRLHRHRRAVTPPGRRSDPLGSSSAPYDARMNAAYSPGDWVNFAIGVATAAGALTGLVFVAVSIRVREVLDDPFHRRRTEST